MNDKELINFEEKIEGLFTDKVEKLHEIVVTTSKITKESGIEAIKDNRISLRDIRLNITKNGKILREKAVLFSKNVIAQEKELTAIITPEEDRLQEIEDELKKEEEKKKRLSFLQPRKEKLLAINGEDFWASDEEILAMDDMRFSTFLNTCKEQDFDNKKENFEKEQEEKRIEDERIANMKKAAEEREREERQKAFDEERAKLDKEKKDFEDKQKAIKEAEDRKALEEKIAKETEEKIRKETEEKAKLAQEEEERLKKQEDIRKADEARKQQDSVRYQEFIKSIGITNENMGEFHKEDTLSEIRVYKLVGTYKK